MATLRKRGAHQWEAQIRRRGYPATSRTFHTKAEAEAWASMIESEMSRGIWISRTEAESTTLRELLDRYEAEIVPAKKGQAQECSILRMWRETELAMRTVAGVRSADVAHLRDKWLRTYEPATVLRRLSVLSHVFNVARKEWGLESAANPVELIRKPVVSNARSRRTVSLRSNVVRPSGTEIDRVVAASESKVLPAIIRLAVETAMRRSEIVAMCWEHVDFQRRVAHLPTTKNGSSRDVPLSSMAVAVLSEMQRRAADGSVSGVLEGRIFKVRSDAVTRAFERAVARARAAYEAECQDAGDRPDSNFLTDLRFHDLRHEAASRLAEVYQLHELAKVTGHKDTRMLMRYYHPRAEDLAKKLA